MVYNSNMFFNYSNNLSGCGNVQGGCCFNGAFSPYYQPNQFNFMRSNGFVDPGYNRPPQASCPYFVQNMQYPQASPYFNSTGNPAPVEDDFSVYINPAQFNMRTVSLEDIID